jgi:hypothetical protein
VYKKYKRKKRAHDLIATDTIDAEKLRDEDEYVSFHRDPEGKIIFLNETITPNWLVEKLNYHFVCERNEGVKCWGLTL